MYLAKLLEYCERKNYPLEIVRNPDDNPEELWEIKVYPHGWDGGNFFSAYDTLEKTAKKLLMEMEVIR